MERRGRLAALLASRDDDEPDAANDAAELDAEVRDRTRHAVGRLALADRLVASIGGEVAVTTYGAGIVRGALADTAPGWLLVGETLIPATAVESVEGLAPGAEQPGPVRRRLTLGYALRALARDATPVALTTTSGATLHGAVGRVGADFVEIGARVVPYAAIAAVRPD